MNSPELLEASQEEVKGNPEEEVLKHLFESTVMFFRIINKTMVVKKYSRQKRRQVFDSIIKRATLDDKDIIKGMMEELKPVLENKDIQTQGEQNV